MLVIRLRRIGHKGDPHYRIVVAEHTAAVQGKFLAEIGHHHPKSKETVIQNDQFLAWLERGAQPSNTVAKLAEKSGIAHERIVVKQFHSQPKKKATIKSAASTEKTKETASAPDDTEAKKNEQPESAVETDSPSEQEETEATT